MSVTPRSRQRGGIDRGRSGRYTAGAYPLAGLDVLDVGCGGGILSESMARLGARVHGIDVVQRNIAAARAHATGSGLDGLRVADRTGVRVNPFKRAFSLVRDLATVPAPAIGEGRIDDRLLARAEVHARRPACGG